MSCVRTSALLLLALILGVSGPARGQETLVGARVRLTLLPSSGDSQPRTVTGRLAELGASTLVLVDSRGRPQPFDRATIARLERSQGRRSRWRLTGIGFAAGAAVGGVTGLMAGEDCHRPGIGPCFSPAATSGLLAVMFGGIGAGVGAVLPPGDRWVAVPPSQAATGN